MYTSKRLFSRPGNRAISGFKARFPEQNMTYPEQRMREPVRPSTEQQLVSAVNQQLVSTGEEAATTGVITGGLAVTMLATNAGATSQAALFFDANGAILRDNKANGADTAVTCVTHNKTDFLETLKTTSYIIEQITFVVPSGQEAGLSSAMTFYSYDNRGFVKPVYKIIPSNFISPDTYNDNMARVTGLNIGLTKFLGIYGSCPAASTIEVRVILK